MNHCPHRPEDFQGFTPKQKPLHKLPMVYVVATHDLAYLNVGMTTAFKTRLHQLRVEWSGVINLWSAIRTPKPLVVMTDLHERLAHARLQGDWFKPRAADLDAVITFCDLTNRNIKEVRRALLQA